MDWNCTLTEERLSDFLEAQLGPAELAAFSTHSKTCGACAGLIARDRKSTRLNSSHQCEP
jgi:anti-sigma factor RsiW